jgi:hypothetical protein
MINNHFADFQLPDNLLKTKKCAPYFRENTEFPIYCVCHLNSKFTSQKGVWTEIGAVVLHIEI